jgi:8-oxo-dGTP diphosphatase
MMKHEEMTPIDYTNSRGVITTAKPDGTERTDYLFRISLKALIYDNDGRILVTREHGLDWHLPGGGLDYGETIEEGFKRELFEEVGYDGELTYQIIGADTMWMYNLEVNLMWIVAVVKPANNHFSIGVDGGDVRFIDHEELATLDGRTSQLSYMFHGIAKNMSEEKE